MATKMNYQSAWSRGVLVCRTCHWLHDSKKADNRCQRCGDPLSARQKNSLSRTWALCIASSFFLLLANIYPIMTISYLGDTSADTIISGIISLVEFGMVPIAIIVFVASIAVPLLKLTTLFWLLLTIQFQWRMNARQCTRLYRVVEFIGRWSMLDLFVIATLVTLAILGGIATISGGPGATYFATVVVLTMLAARTFDPRLIWDLQDSETTND